jgi:hypothetical protein
VAGELVQPHRTFFTLDGGLVWAGSTLDPKVVTSSRSWRTDLRPSTVVD